MAGTAQAAATTETAPPISPIPIPERPRGLLALDIDGTLLGPGGALSERTRAAVRAAGQAGWLVTLATGRRWGSTTPVAAALGLRAPLITFNGALTRDPASGALLRYTPLDPAVIEPFVRALVERGLQPVLYEDIRVGERFLTGPADFDSAALHGWFNGLSVEYGQEVVRLAHGDLAHIGGAVRIIVYDAEERVRGVQQVGADLGVPTHTIFYPVERYNALMAELIHPDSTKARAIAALAAHYGLATDATIAVGDGSNDLEMIAEAGVGVAMGQAIPEIKARAALTIGDHASDGLAQFIEDELLRGDGFPDHLRAAHAGRGR